jgi:hypothetical protein
MIAADDLCIKQTDHLDNNSLTQTLAGFVSFEHKP